MGKKSKRIGDIFFVVICLLVILLFVGQQYLGWFGGNKEDRVAAARETASEAQFLQEAGDTTLVSIENGDN